MRFIQDQQDSITLPVDVTQLSFLYFVFDVGVKTHGCHGGFIYKNGRLSWIWVVDENLVDGLLHRQDG